MTADSDDAYQESDKYADDSLNDDEVGIVTDGADGSPKANNDSDELESHLLDPTQTASEAPGKRHGAQRHQAEENESERHPDDEREAGRLQVRDDAIGE